MLFRSAKIYATQYKKIQDYVTNFKNNDSDKYAEFLKKEEIKIAEDKKKKDEKKEIAEIQNKGEDLVGTEVTVCGFMEANRGKGAICFVDLRDGTGKLQVFLKGDTVGEENLDLVQRMTRESTLQFTGVVAKKRPPKVKEGETPPPPAYEVVASDVNVLTRANVPLPLGITDTVSIGLDTRLDNRFLDLLTVKSSS